MPSFALYKPVPASPDPNIITGPLERTEELGELEGPYTSILVASYRVGEL